MTTLRVIVDAVLDTASPGIARYAEELTRELIATAPRGCTVEGFVSACTDAAYADLESRLPGLVGLHKSALGRRELSFAWQHGFAPMPPGDMIHAPSLLAPLTKHDRRAGDQQVVATIHDATAWTHPELVPSRVAAWQRAMARRAQRHADAIVVPTHAVAEELSAYVDFGERVRVISAGVSARMKLPRDHEARAVALGLPERYVFAHGSTAPRKGLEELVHAMALTRTALPLVLAIGDPEERPRVEELVGQTGLAERVLLLGRLADADLATAIARSNVFVQPSIAEGLGLSVIEAMSLGAPVVHADVPALLEIAADAGHVVAREDRASYPQRLAAAIDEVVEDAALAERLSVEGVDRAKVFTWRDSAEKVWALHADL